MSGGVDSSVAAALLLQQGYRVVGVTMKLWDYPPGITPSLRGCCSLDDTQDAASVASKLGIPHYTLNLKDEFRLQVIDNFIAEYKAGRTPNPCIRCNTFLKWGALFSKMQELNLDCIATGHYARVECENGEYRLLKSSIPRKDQSYALWGIPCDKLPRTVFPLGNLAKEEVRKIADSLGFKNADKPESQEICFIPDNDYGNFLTAQGVKSVEGDIIGPDGKIIGRHPGYIYYTLGQRKGLGGGAPYPLFVNRIDTIDNKVYAGPRQSVVFSTLKAVGVNWLTNEIPSGEFPAVVKIRYADPGRKAMVTPHGASEISCRFPDGVEAPTPGQSAVVYEEDRVLCGGIIECIVK